MPGHLGFCLFGKQRRGIIPAWPFTDTAPFQAVAIEQLQEYELGGALMLLPLWRGFALARVISWRYHANIIAVGQLDIAELPPHRLDGRAVIAFGLVDAEILGALVLLQPQIIGLFFRHAVEDTRRAHRVMNGAGAANVGSTVVAIGAGGGLAHVVGDLDGAVMRISDAGENPDNGIHLGVVGFRHTVQRDQRIEGYDIDLIFLDLSIDAVNKLSVNV